MNVGVRFAATPLSDPVPQTVSYPPLETRPVLMVIGMHRSGTSATTGALGCVGVRLGRRLYAGHAGINPKGYFEHSEIADADDEALLTLGSCWDDVLPREDGWAGDKRLLPLARHMLGVLRRELQPEGLFAVKDPRVCRLLPWWQAILAEAPAEPAYLFVVRAPQEVCASLQKRDGFSADKSQILWLRHYLEAEAATRGARRAVLDFASFIARPVDELRRVEAQLGLNFPRAPADAASDLAAFISGDLKHHTAGTGAPPQGWATLAEALHRVMQDAARDGGAIDTDRVDAVAVELAQRFAATMPPLAIEHMRQLGARRGQHELAVNRFMRSWSLWVGKPVRAVERVLGRNV
jgi:hypothetical protein